jgi:hypothetical protein
MQKWEYCLTDWPSREKEYCLTDWPSREREIEELLDSWGNEGWELAAIYDGKAYFKRKIKMSGVVKC